MQILCRHGVAGCIGVVVICSAVHARPPYMSHACLHISSEPARISPDEDISGCPQTPHVTVGGG